jgi:hypothetical protein
LALESSETIRNGREGSRKNLDGDVTTETRVAGAIDFAHAAAPEERDDLVGPSRVPADKATCVCPVNALIVAVRRFAERTA